MHGGITTHVCKFLDLALLNPCCLSIALVTGPPVIFAYHLTHYSLGTCKIGVLVASILSPIPDISTATGGGAQLPGWGLFVLLHCQPTCLLYMHTVGV